ncbi:MAG: FAD-linked oxidase C-terminal domain-containing protein [Gemmataceae bacterium]
MLTPAQLAADLRPTFRGELFIDPATRAVYSTDASPFQVMPLAVACPRDEADVQAAVKFAAEQGLSITPRGAGTGRAGESLGPGLILDLSVHFRGLPRLDGDLVHILPGLTYAELQDALLPYDRRLAPHPPAGRVGTLGGLLACNASGSNAAVHGTIRSAVTSLRVVWDSGEANDLTEQPSNLERTGTIQQSIDALISENREVIRGNRRRTPFDRCGYALGANVDAKRADLRTLMIGSEGTLGIITAATLRTIPLAGGTAAVQLGFTAIEDAAKAGVVLRNQPGVVVCDLLDRRHLAMAQGTMVTTECEAAIFLVTEASSPNEAIDAVQNALRSLEPVCPFKVLKEPTLDLIAFEGFHAAAVSGLWSMRGGPKPISVIDDVGVPPEVVPEFLVRVQSLVRSRDLTAAIHAHSPTGAVHILPIVDLNVQADREKLWPLADAVYAMVLDLGGTISTHSAVGLSRTPWVRTQSAINADLYREVKRIFDPKNLFNPGNIVGPDPTRPAWPLRQIVPEKMSLPVDEVNACNSCGECRPRSGIERMCPIFKATGLETATPRAKVQLSRRLDDPDLFREPEAIRNIAKLCVNCKMCRSECHSHVDVPRLVAETKAQLWREHGTDRANWFLARAESLVGLASSLTLTSNVLLGSRAGRWILSRLFGLDPTVRLPSLRYRSFTWRAWTRGWTRRNKGESDKRVALFLDPLSNATDPLTGEAAVAVLKHNGADVTVVSRSRPTGMAALTAGDQETARAQAKRTLRLLAEYVHEGYRIVCLDPNAAVAITQEYPALLREEDADLPLVARSTCELMTLLGQWHEAGTFKTDFREQDLTLGHHVPCHMKALPGSLVTPRLLSLIPGVNVRTFDSGCSGMAGPWGMLARNREVSRAAGASMLEAFGNPETDYGSSECGSCRIQMQDATGKRAVHPVQYLAMAYGLLPEVGRRLVTPLKDRVSR